MASGQDSEAPTSGRIVGARRVKQLSVFDVVHPGPFRMAEHSHARACINLVVGGTYRERVRHVRRTEFAPGCLLFKPPQCPHSNQIDGGAVRSLIIELSRSDYDLALGFDDVYMNPWTLLHPNTSRIAQRLYVEMYTTQPDDDWVVEGLIWELVAASADAKSRRSWERPAWFRDVIAFMHDQHPLSPSIRELASVAGVCPTHLARAFRNSMNCSPGEYMRALKVAEAVDRLEDGRATNAQIAAECGFADESHMIRVMRIALQTTPAKLRRAMAIGRAAKRQLRPASR